MVGKIVNGARAPNHMPTYTETPIDIGDLCRLSNPHCEAEREVAAGRAMLDIRHPVEGGATTDPRQPEEAIAFRPEEIRSMLAGAGLAIREPVHPGLWANAPGGLTLQDVIVAERPA